MPRFCIAPSILSADFARLGDEVREVTAGDCIVIAPGTPHKLWNTGDGPLRLLCCCAPAYTHDDTVLTGG